MKILSSFSYLPNDITNSCMVSLWKASIASFSLRSLYTRLLFIALRFHSHLPLQFEKIFHMRYTFFKSDVIQDNLYDASWKIPQLSYAHNVMKVILDRVLITKWEPDSYDGKWGCSPIQWGEME